MERPRIPKGFHHSAQGGQAQAALSQAYIRLNKIRSFLQVRVKLGRSSNPAVLANLPWPQRAPEPEPLSSKDEG
jgi:hypothetical protein